MDVFNTLVIMLFKSVQWASDEQTYTKNRTNQLPNDVLRIAADPTQNKLMYYVPGVQ